MTHIRQTPDEKAEWESTADSKDMKLSEFVRHVINRYIARRKKKSQK